jgi:hypothetical protein
MNGGAERVSEMQQQNWNQGNEKQYRGMCEKRIRAGIVEPLWKLRAFIQYVFLESKDINAM